MQNESIYSIRALAQKSGISMYTIRAWEKRYQALRPQRSPGNRRLYTRDDLTRLQLLKQAVAEGHTIGVIAGLPTPELWRLVHGQAGPAAEAENPEQSPAVDSLLESCWQAVLRFDDLGLQNALHQGAVTLSQPVLLEQLLSPLLQRIGHGWSEGRLRILNEHMATVVIRDYLTTLRLAYKAESDAPAIVVATPAGQMHEMGALFAALTAAAQGWRVYYAGTSLPADELAAATRKLNARILALGLVQPTNDPQISAQLEILRTLADQETIIVAGGAAAFTLQHLLERLSIHFIRDMAHLREFLQKQRTRQP